MSVDARNPASGFSSLADRVKPVSRQSGSVDEVVHHFADKRVAAEFVRPGVAAIDRDARRRRKNAGDAAELVGVRERRRLRFAVRVRMSRHVSGGLMRASLVNSRPGRGPASGSART